MKRLTALAALLAIGLGACRDQASGGGGTRSQIAAVGSSTVYPFTTIAAERFLAADRARAPVIESTGTGAGMNLFCGGIGARYPDIENASRRMKRAEYDLCQRNGVGEILEVQVGIDGIAFAESVRGPEMQLTSTDIYRALAARPLGRPNTARTWREVNPALPALPIQVYGPPSTSGTRDALAELIMAKGCEAFDPAAKALKARDKDGYEARCLRVREDGSYIDAGENDNLIVQKLATNADALGVFGYSYLEENAGSVRGVPLNGVAPSYRAIASSDYPGARPLFLYVKKAHLRAIPGLQTFLGIYATLWHPGGPLAKRGLIVAPAPVRARSAAVVRTGTPLNATELH